MLLAVEERSGRILNVSANSADVIGRDPAELLNARIDSLIGGGALERLRRAVARVSALSPSFVERFEAADGREFDVLVHQTGDTLIVEFDRADTRSSSQQEALLGDVRAAVTRIQSSTDFAELADIVVREIAHISGFERVMLYRFDAEWNGEVIAETKAPDLAPFLGLHYPASDIPRQARELYRRKMLGVIPNAVYTPVPLVPQRNPLDGRPIDLSMATLRSVSPVHLEYLANMGVAATLTISLLKHGQLWGMIAAHHRDVRFSAPQERVACEIIGRTAALQITTLEDAAENALRLRLRSLQPALLDTIDRDGEITEAIAVDALLRITGAEGAAIKTEGEPHVVGNAPSRRDIRRIIAWLEERDSSDGDQPFATDRLPIENPQFADLKDVACGLLAVPLTSTKGGWILWFRPEVVRTVSWGGDPAKRVSEDGQRISPRKSFEAWKELVSLQAAPWQRPQVEAAVELRRIVSDVMMRRAREYAALNAELARSNQELESFAHVASHDLKEPLRGMYHYAQFLQQDYGERLDGNGRQMLDSMMALANRMEQQVQSLLSLAEVGHDSESQNYASADAALDEVLALLEPRLHGVSIERVPLPAVRVAHARMREVFVNLISNALKYNDKETVSIQIGLTGSPRPASQPLPPTADPETGSMATMFVRDNGIGIKPKHLETVFRMFKRLHARDAYGGGTGAGLAIARKIIEQQGGSMWVESVPGEGSTFYFTVPLAEE